MVGEFGTLVSGKLLKFNESYLGHRQAMKYQEIVNKLALGVALMLQLFVLRQCDETVQTLQYPSFQRFPVQISAPIMLGTVKTLCTTLF